VPFVEVIEPALWLITAGVFALASLLVLIQKRRWRQPLLVAALALLACGWMMFWQPPSVVGVAVTVILVVLLG
jgi:hypothetical protein